MRLGVERHQFQIVFGFNGIKNRKLHRELANDFPLRVLVWFPWTLEEFRNPPSEGGLHAGAMTTKDMDVGGEMLCVQSTSDGYALVNRSRNKQDPISDYDPVDTSLSWQFCTKTDFSTDGNPCGKNMNEESYN